ncbi:transposase-like zinc-binding domain-containing protein [Plantibacter sp. Mn2098]|uniref:IS1/IS1595 family N-terminal zinc-binding domain-containing protein n=1 Tax=Plantibacter sp. Mn2098 TaxID=3395266 RepID=UPI003BC96C38
MCGSRLVKNGRHPSATQRWRCPSCGSSSVRRRPDVSRREDLRAFASWLVGTHTKPRSMARPPVAHSDAAPDGVGTSRQPSDPPKRSTTRSSLTASGSAPSACSSHSTTPDTSWPGNGALENQPQPGQRS